MYVVKKRKWEILVALTNSHLISEVCPSLPRFDGMALNHVHYAVGVREVSKYVKGTENDTENRTWEHSPVVILPLIRPFPK